MRNYAVVTGSYWSFTLTDGALRMLVLLHFYSLGYTPFMLAFLFLLYESGGHLRQSRRRLAGGALRHSAHAGGRPLLADRRAADAVGACSPGWGAALSVAWVVLAQGIAGVAKDITKTASKVRDQGDIGAGQRGNCSAGSRGSPARRTP